MRTRVPDYANDYLVVHRHTKEVENTLYNVMEEIQEEQNAKARKNVHRWAVRRELFTFAKMEATREVVRFLTHAQLGHLLMLTTFISYRDNIIRNTDKSPMTNKDIIKTLRMSKQTFYDFVKVCLENNIMSKTEEGLYKVNSEYHLNGELKGEKKVVRIYNTEVRTAFKELKPAELGLLYLLIPYVHYQTNFLCANPYEEDPTQLEKLNRTEISELLGIDPATFTRKFKKIEFNGQKAIATIKLDNNEDSYIFNPWVMARIRTIPSDEMLGMEVDTSKPDATLRAIFSGKKKGK